MIGRLFATIICRIHLAFAAQLAVLVLFGVGCKLSSQTPAESPLVPKLESIEHQSIYGMVVSGVPDATAAAVEILESGGNAVDAAVAAAFMIGVVDPADSGLGGSTFMLIRMADGRTAAIDGSSRVPLRVDAERVMTASSLGEQSRGIELAGTPGSLSALDLAMTNYGTLGLAGVLQPAIRAAEQGFYLREFQYRSVVFYLESIRQSEYLRLLLLEDGEQPYPSQEKICNPDLARTLRRLAQNGARDFYRGHIAEDIETDMKRRGGLVRRGDLALMEARELVPIVGSYRGREILTFPNPCAGAEVIEGLNILETFPTEFLIRQSVDRMQATVESFHIALNDRRRFLGNANAPESVRFAPHLTKEHAAQRARLLRFDRALSDEEINISFGFERAEGDTTHISVLDKEGNAVSMTQTLGRFFGCKVLATDLGFIYNNVLEGLTRFQARSVVPNDMAPSIVVEDGEPLLVLGSAGSSRIPGAIASVIVNVIDRKMSVGDAIAAPRTLWGSGMRHLGALIEVAPPISEDDLRDFLLRGYTDPHVVRFPASRVDLASMGAVNAVHFDRRTRTMTGSADQRRLGSSKGADY